MNGFMLGKVVSGSPVSVQTLFFPSANNYSFISITFILETGKQEGRGILL